MTRILCHDPTNLSLVVCDVVENTPLHASACKRLMKWTEVTWRPSYGIHFMNTDLYSVFFQVPNLQANISTYDVAHYVKTFTSQIFSIGRRHFSVANPAVYYNFIMTVRTYCLRSFCPSAGALSQDSSWHSGTSKWFLEPFKRDAIFGSFS